MSLAGLSKDDISELASLGWSSLSKRKAPRPDDPKPENVFGLKEEAVGTPSVVELENWV